MNTTTLLTLQRALKVKRGEGKLPNTQIPRVICNDKTVISIQASEFHYCHPRNNNGPWDEVEIGFPTCSMEGFEQYDDGTGDVFSFVPIELVVELINKHGGIHHFKSEEE